MKENTTIISELIYKHISETISEDEEKELQQWIKSDVENENLFLQLNNNEELKKNLIQLFDYDEEKGWENLLNKIHDGSAKEKRKNLFLLARRISVAATIAAIVFSVYFIVSKQTKTLSKEIISGNKSYDLPGKNGAILVLDNGQHFMLDSAENGKISQQNNIDVQKKDGQLIYEGNAGNTELVYNTMITPRARQYSLILSDGTKVWLNSASSIKFPVAFGPDTRKVEITGEVYFEVAHAFLPGSKIRKPFIVHVNSANVNNNMEIEVLGTHFNVNSYDDEDVIKTTLFEGKINLKNSIRQMAVLPGQQVVTIRKNNISKIINDIDVDQVLAWKNGKFEFDNTELPTIMRQISRWYNVEVVFEGQPGNEKYFGGISKSVPLSDVLRMLEANNVKFRIKENKIFVKP